MTKYLNCYIVFIWWLRGFLKINGGETITVNKMKKLFIEYRFDMYKEVCVHFDTSGKNFV